MLAVTIIPKDWLECELPLYVDVMVLEEATMADIRAVVHLLMPTLRMQDPIDSRGRLS